MNACFSILALSATLVTPQLHASDRHESIKQEVRQAIARGNTWLRQQQKTEGNWDDPELPAFTALALNALVRDPGFDRKAPLPPHIEKGYQWLLAQQKEDGGIYNRGLSSYNTATSVTSLMAVGQEKFEPAVVKARKHLIEKQWDIGESGTTDNKNDGGIGYGSSNKHTDLSNTYLALEAIALSQKVVQDGKYGDQPELNWDAARTFLSRCQNLEETNDQDWASNDPKNKGGFIYTPGQSKAGEEKTADGRTALRSYGSISYAGLQSMIYAKMSLNDIRVKAVMNWLGQNYTLDENPGMGKQGMFYYYQTMAKALSVANVNDLELADGKKADWRSDLASKLLSEQRENDSWVNENGRWMESNPILVTAFTVLALAQIHDSIP